MATTRRVILASGAIAIALLADAAPAAWGQERRARTVLAVFAGAADAPSNLAINAALRDTLRARGDVDVDLFGEYLESDRLTPGDGADALRDAILRKYRQRPIDVVIAVSDIPLAFVMRNRSLLFADVPIVFSGLSPPDAAARRAGAGVTGVVGAIALHETVQLARRLHPDTRRIYVLEAGAESTFVRGQLTTLAGGVEVKHVNEANLGKLLETVQSVPPQSVIVLVLATRASGGLYQPAEIAQRVAQTASVPVYSISDGFIGSGVVGTGGTALHDVGSGLGRLALEILDGRSARDLPLLEFPRRPVVDWRQILAWGIDPGLLPAAAEIRFKQATVWELYWPYIIGAISLFAFQGALIAALVFQRSRRRQMEAHNAAILRAAPDLMFLLSRDGVFLSHSAPQGTTRLMPPENFLGKQLRDVLPPDLAAQLTERFAQLVPGRTAEIIEYGLPVADGERKFEARLVTVGDDKVLAVVRDITERHRAEAALNEAQAELRKTSRLTALGQFAASIAHEIRQPLTAIVLNARSCLRVLDKTPHDLEEVRCGLLDVIEAGQRAEEVIRRNRRLFRDQTVEAEPLDINSVITGAIALAGPPIEQHGVTILSSLASHLPAVSGDLIELQQVLLNLITNAAEAMDGSDTLPRCIRVVSSLEGEQVKVAVTDNGVGLGGVSAHQMFSLAYTTKATGTGVGLALSRSIIEAHGGTLRADDNPDGGATFSFTIPALPLRGLDSGLVPVRQKVT